MNYENPLYAMRPELITPGLTVMMMPVIPSCGSLSNDGLAYAAHWLTTRINAQMTLVLPDDAKVTTHPQRKTEPMIIVRGTQDDDLRAQINLYGSLVINEAVEEWREHLAEVGEAKGFIAKPMIYKDER